MLVKKANIFRINLYLLLFAVLLENNAMSVSQSTQVAMDEISSLIAEKYIDENISQYAIDQGALDGMLSALDPYSTYYNNEELQNFNNNTDGKFYGIGTEMVIDNDTRCAIITSIIQNSPAAKAGIIVGDIITHIDDDSVVGSKLSTIARKIRGDIGTSVRITFYRPQTKETFTRLITRQKIDIKNVSSKIYDKNIAVIKIEYFNNTTYDNFVDELNTIMGKYDIKGLIIDLRNNPGGLLNSSVDIANLFLRNGQLITSVKTRNNQKTYDYIARNTIDLFKDIKIAVLINKGSASASEILAGALQDQGVAKLIGEKSFGKALVQEVFKLKKSQGAVKITTGKYYTPKDKQINGIGIQPDIEIPDSKNNKYDSILQYGIRYIKNNIKNN